MLSEITLLRIKIIDARVKFNYFSYRVCKGLCPAVDVNRLIDGDDDDDDDRFCYVLFMI